MGMFVYFIDSFITSHVCVYMIACNMNVHKRCQKNVANNCGINTKEMAEILNAIGVNTKINQRKKKVNYFHFQLSSTCLELLNTVGNPRLPHWVNAKEMGGIFQWVCGIAVWTLIQPITRNSQCAMWFVNKNLKNTAMGCRMSAVDLSSFFLLHNFVVFPNWINLDVCLGGMLRAESV